MDLRLEIKIDDFNAAMADMNRRLGNATTKRAIVDGEVAKVLEKTLAGTKVATRASINDSIKRTEWTTFPAKWNGGGGKRYLLSNHYPNALWSRIQSQMAASLARKVAAIGAARKSWWAMGVRLGYSIADRGSSKAVIPGHTADENVSVLREASEGNYMLTVKNDSPLMRWTDGRRAFFSAIAGRVGFFRQNLARGVFNDLKAVQAKYPGIEIHPPI